MNPLRKLPLDRILRTTKEYRRLSREYNLNCGWLVKYGHYYSIAIDNKLVNLEIKTLCLTGQQFIDFVNREQNKRTKEFIDNLNKKIKEK